MTRSYRNARIAATLMLVALAAGCSGNIQTGFEGDITKPLDGIPTGSVPVEGDGPFPTVYCYQANGQYTQSVATTRGTSNYDWALGGTCVNRPIRETWAALNNPDTMRWPEAESYSAGLGAPPAGTQIFWGTHYHLTRFPVGSVDWDMSWYHTILQGSPAAPRQIVINYAKVNGTSFIQHWQGSMLLEFVEPGVTSITIKDTLSATNENSQNCENTVKALINRSRTEAAYEGPINDLPNATVPVPNPSSSPGLPTPEPSPSPTGPADPFDPDPCDYWWDCML